LGLPQFTREELLASLLMFRFLYFMLPLSVAALLLGARELSLLAGLAIKFPAGRKRLARCVRSAVGKSSRYAGSTRADTG
jgi:hypothetical protein